MILDNVINAVVITGWIVLFAFVLRFFIYRMRYEGFWAAVKALFKASTLYIIFLVVMVLSIINTSLVFVLPQEVGVVVSLVTPSGYRPQPLRSGLHWIVPLAEEVHIMPIYWQTYTMAGKPNEGAMAGDDSIVARTSDGQEVSIDCTVIFRIDAEGSPRVYIDWQDRYITDFIRPIIRGLVRTYVSQYKVDEVNSSKRMDLETDLSRELSTILNEKGFLMDSFLVRNITFSEEYSNSVEQKQVAYQDTIRKEYEAEQLANIAQGEADRLLTVANAEAQAIEILGQALATNPDVITLRYVDKLAPNVQVMLLPNDNPFLLTLPQLTPNAETQTGTQPTPTPTVGSALPEPILAVPTATVQP